MDKLLQDIEKFCSMSSAEREEVYRKSIGVARINELWTEQELEDREMDLLIKGRASCCSGTAIVTLNDKASDFGESITETLDALNVALDMAYKDLELEYGDLDLMDAVELISVLDKELIKYNNMI